MIKIFIPTEKFWPEYAGWIRQTILIVKHIPGFNFISFSRPSSNKKNMAELPGNVQLINVGPDTRQQTVLSQFIFVTLAIWKLLTKKFDFNLVFLPYSYYPGFIFMILGKLINKPVVARVSGRELESNSIAAKLRYYTFSKIDQVIVLNEASIPRLIDLGVNKENISFIPNGVVIPDNPVNFTGIRNEKFDSDSEILILFAGIVCKRKGVNELINAFNLVNDMGINCRLLVAGPIHGTQESDDEYTEMIISKTKNSDKIDLLGNIENMSELYKKSDIFVLPSYSEGMPNALLEAMSFGLPSIATNIPGVNDVIRQMENGILFEPGDIEKLSSLLYKLVADSGLRNELGKNGLETIRSKFSIERTSEMYKSLFTQLIESN